jgi:hypothetical protein
MDALYFKAERLKSLWEEYRQTNQCTGTEYSDVSAWAREQLQVWGRLSLFQRVIASTLDIRTHFTLGHRLR